MALVTTLTIKNLEVQYSLDSLTDVVVSVGAQLSGSDGGTAAQVGNRYRIAAPDPSSFVTFADLTKSDVINFVKATDTYSTAVQQLTAKIDRKNQSGRLPLPWEA